MRATNLARASARGVVMLMVIILVALLIIIALIVASGAFNAETSVEAVAVKYRVLNSAEGAANGALNQLAEDPSVVPTCYPGTLNGMTNTGCIEVNNLLGAFSTPGVDPATGNSVNVPPKSAYIYGESSYSGGRKVYIEAIGALAPPLALPGGAINAAGSVNDLTPELISADPQAVTDDANIGSNADINVIGSPSVVHGATSAVGIDSLAGTVGPPKSHAGAILFPSATQIQQAAQNAKAIAQGGTLVSGSTLSAGRGGAVTGNAYVNGDLMLSAGTVTFTNGSYVYINGNVCVSGTGALANLNTGQNVVVVSGVVSVKSASGFLTSAGQNSLLLVMGVDPAPSSPCGSGSTAVDLEQPSGITPIGTVYAANGSLYMGGASTQSGALDASGDILIGGASSSNFIYDATQAQTTLTTGTLTYTAYNEY
jgi:hypothetical protein